MTIVLKYSQLRGMRFQDERSLIKILVNEPVVVNDNNFSVYVTLFDPYY